ncbi:MAG: hypothetical protein ACYCWW_12490 [Deltaproteobacteria bacterium]
MSPFDPHARARAATERLFVRGRLRDGAFLALHEHLRGCDDCRRFYDRLSGVEQALEPGAPLIPSDELRQLFRILRPSASVRRPAEPSSSGRALRFGIGGAILAGALAAALILPRRHPSEASFQPRGLARPGPIAGVRAFCLDPAGRVLGDIDLRPGPGPGGLVTLGSSGPALRCPRDGALQFSYTASGAAAGRLLTIVGIGPAGELHRYAPRPGAPSPSLREGQDRPLPGSLRLAVRHPAGAYRLLAVTSSRPLDDAALAALAKGLPVDGAGAVVGELEVGR